MEDTEKLLDHCAKMAARLVGPRYTRFLDPAQNRMAEQCAARNGVEVSFWGGYPDAERTIACFHPAGYEPEEGGWPLSLLRSHVNLRFSSITHRDLLGAFMALGLTRDCVGDMIIDNEEVFVFASEHIAQELCVSFDSAGHVPLHFSVLDSIPRMPEPKGSWFTSVITSLRLDAVLAAAYKLSRNEASEAVRSGLVKLDHLPCERTDAPVADGVMLSLRGRGRVRLASVDGQTKKQRFAVTFFRYE